MANRVVVQRLYIRDNIRLMGDRRRRTRWSHFHWLLGAENWVVGTVYDSNATMLRGKPNILVSDTLKSDCIYLSLEGAGLHLAFKAFSQDIEQF